MTLRMASLILAFVLMATGSTVAQTVGPEAKAEQGRTVYQYWCATCHSPGRENPGTAALAVKYKAQPAIPAVLAERTNFTPQSIKFFVRQGVSVMPPFRKTEISDADLDALSAFMTRNNRR